MEITIISAQGLKIPSSLFSRRLRPFITLTAHTPITNGDKPCHVYTSRIDDHGGLDPTWGDKFHLPLTHSFIYIQLYTKRLIVGPVQLGWCQIPAGDFSGGFGTVRHLSYRLRDRDGTRGHGVLNISVKLDGWVPVERPLPAVKKLSGDCGTVMGFPVGMLPAVRGQLGVSCEVDKSGESGS